MSTKRKVSQKLGQPMVKPSAKPTTKASLDDSKTVVTSGSQFEAPEVNGSQEVVEISSDSSSEYDDDEDEAAEDGEDADQEEKDGGDEEVAADVVNGDKITGQTTQPNGDDVEMEDAADAEPSFGDLVHAITSEPIDVAAAFTDPSAPTLVYPHNSALAVPSGASLGTVLTQALKTNDVSLLESCLQTTDTSTIRSTIQRLSSPLASTLLSKLATRLHNRPGRAGSLMIWIQWTLVTHGGYLATQRDLMKKLSELNRVLEVRARGLQSLLSLKGKLDMLEAQIQLRRSMRDQRRAVEDEEDEPGVIYVEGEESEEDQNGLEAASRPNGTSSKSSKRVSKAYQADSDSEDSEDMPNGTATEALLNGDEADDDDEEEESSDEEDEDLIDDEAEETDADSGDEDDVNHDDQDSVPDEDDSDDDIPPSKLQKVGGLFEKH